MAGSVPADRLATVGVLLLVAISAPTGLALHLAEARGPMPVGFARPGQHVIYSHPHPLQS